MNFSFLIEVSATLLEVAASSGQLLFVLIRTLVGNQYPRQNGDKGCQNQEDTQGINPELPIQLAQIHQFLDQPLLLRLVTIGHVTLQFSLLTQMAYQLSLDR